MVQVRTQKLCLPESRYPLVHSNCYSSRLSNPKLGGQSRKGKIHIHARDGVCIRVLFSNINVADARASINPYFILFFFIPISVTLFTVSYEMKIKNKNKKGKGKKLYAYCAVKREHVKE